MTLSRILAALAALSVLALGACATAPQTAAMRVFPMDQPHPAVTKAVGPMKTYTCQGSAEAAQNTLRAHAAAAGADALVDYQWRVLSAPAHAQQCQRLVEAQAVAVVLTQGASAHASISDGTLRP
jgi:hypothetical protein